ncbi:MAG: hypothetical protein IPI67_19370 [Myxococcales bacterium]|nr:hypothetical protein [Myxococcales bacterium]
MLRARRAQAHRALGFSSFAEYIARLFGYTPRWTAERLRVAEALEHLPETEQHLRDGVVSWSAVRELTRVAIPRTESAWLARARDRSLREIERAVAGRKPGDTPDSPPDRSLIRHVLRFDVSAETLASFREAQSALVRDAGGALDDDAMLLELARRALGGPSEPGRASYQIALTLCESCGRGAQKARDQAIEVDAAIVAMASCDAQLIGNTNHHAHGNSPPAEPRTHVGAPPRPPAASKRTTQTLPPRLRRHVLARDGGRCTVPGCSNALFLDVHHIELRSEGGRHEADALTTLCGAHHRALHEGTLLLSGRVSSGLQFRHADGTAYGRKISPERVDACIKTHQALRALGFREGETARALEAARQHAPGNADTEQLLREALLVLTDARAA